MPGTYRDKPETQVVQEYFDVSRQLDEVLDSLKTAEKLIVSSLKSHKFDQVRKDKLAEIWNQEVVPGLVKTKALLKVVSIKVK